LFIKTRRLTNGINHIRKVVLILVFTNTMNILPSYNLNKNFILRVLKSKGIVYVIQTLCHEVNDIVPIFRKPNTVTLKLSRALRSCL